MPRNEDSYKPGERAEYHEGGTIMEVAVVENESDAKQINYQLKIKRVIQSGPLSMHALKINSKFKFTKARDAGGFGGLGHLMELEN